MHFGQLVIIGPIQSVTMHFSHNRAGYSLIEGHTWFRRECPIVALGNDYFLSSWEEFFFNI